MVKKLGFIGLGQMGGPMARNLLKSGFELTVFDTCPERVGALAKEGARAAASSREVGAASEVVLTMLPMAPFDPTLEEEILGENGILASMAPGGIIMDGGNTAPKTVQRLAELAKVKGVDVLDIPLSGGPEGAVARQLSIMVGGDAEAFQRARPVLEALGSKITYFGGPGMGQVVKLVNNMIVNIGLATISEALIFGTRMGVDPKMMYEAIKTGAARSWVLDVYGSGLLGRVSGSSTGGGGFTGARKGGRDKQLAWAFEMAADADVPVPLTSAAHELFKMARCLGKDGLFEPIAEMWEDMTGVAFRANSPDEEGKAC
jgi:3-hydroxyisobutyrate dehydrogenase-like beta-hydroxyacid dehydrogenase